MLRQSFNIKRVAHQTSGGVQCRAASRSKKENMSEDSMVLLVFNIMSGIDSD